MNVHYVWIGSSEIPTPYLNNFKKCIKLNPQFSFNIWKNEDCLKIIEEYNLVETFTPLPLIGKCNLLKYIILHKFGGIYTDFDIEWKVSFTRIITDFDFSNVDVILTQTNDPLFDDPFIISKPNIFGSCISFCKNRTNLKIDGELFKSTGEIKNYKLEPFGPFGLTEWLQNSTIKYSWFPQETLLDYNGFFGKHQQKSTWKKS